MHNLKKLAHSLAVVALFSACKSTDPNAAQQLGVTTSPDKACAHTASEFHCVAFLSNHDGDTVTFEISEVHPLLGHKITVRVFGLDTPEIIGGTHPCEKERADEAKAFVEKFLTTAKRIDLTQVERDKYFRVLAHVVADGADMTEALLKANLAVTYFGDTKLDFDWCKKPPQKMAMSKKS